MHTTEDTIAAIATARGEAGVAVIRVSGKQALHIGTALFSGKKPFQGGKIHHGWITDDGNIVDEVLLLAFKAPRSYTGDDTIEIHCHGGEALTHKILNLCIQQGARLANPGEFTLRAFLNGKMDLTQAESVMDLVSARSEKLLLQASANLKNRSLGQYIDQIGQKIMDLQAQIVANVDFPDEVDEPDRILLQVYLNDCLKRIGRLRESAQRNRMVREGIKVAILGMPNAGKSSLFNLLLASDRSIVTSEAGTTRDVVTESFELDGITVTLIDTAGIRETQHSIEMMGIERSWKAANEAQVVLYLVDTSVGLLRYDSQILSKLDPAMTIVIGNKNDLSNGQKRHSDWLYISAKTGDGMDEIYRALRQKIRHISPEDASMTLALNQRQISCCEAIEDCLQQAQEALSAPQIPLDVVTVPLTDALRKLDELMGRDTSEEVLTNVFQQFCVGK